MYKFVSLNLGIGKYANTCVVWIAVSVVRRRCAARTSYLKTSVSTNRHLITLLKWIYETDLRSIFTKHVFLTYLSQLYSEIDGKNYYISITQPEHTPKNQLIKLFSLKWAFYTLYIHHAQEYNTNSTRQKRNSTLKKMRKNLPRIRPS